MTSNDGGSPPPRPTSVTSIASGSDDSSQSPNSTNKGGRSLSGSVGSNRRIMRRASGEHSTRSRSGKSSPNNSLRNPRTSTGGSSTSQKRQMASSSFSNFSAGINQMSMNDSNRSFSYGASRTQMSMSTGKLAGMLGDLSDRSLNSEANNSNNFHWNKSRDSVSTIGAINSNSLRTPPPSNKSNPKASSLIFSPSPNPCRSNRRATMSAFLHNKPPPTLASTVTATDEHNCNSPDSKDHTLRPSNDDSLALLRASVMQRPSSQFSTQLARQFLDESVPHTTINVHIDPSHTDLDPCEYTEAFETGIATTGIANLVAAATTDLEWNPEAQRRQQDEWRSYQRRGIHEIEKQTNSDNNSTASTNFPRRIDLREVDQTVNLMDASVIQEESSRNNDNNRRGTYYSHSRTNNSNANNTTAKNNNTCRNESTTSYTSFFTSTTASLVDIFLDERSIEGNKEKRKKRKGRRQRPFERTNNCFQDLCCSKFTILLIIAALLGATIAWRTGAFTSKSNNPFSSDQLTGPPAPDTAPPTNPDVEVSVEDPLMSLLLGMGVSTLEELETKNSPQYVAYQWIHALQDPTLLAVQSPKDEAELHQILLEAYALSVFYFQTNGYLTYNTTSDASRTIWRDNTNWMRPTPICHWYGLDCEGEMHVVHLNLTRNNLKGQLPKELKVLSDLRTLDLARCGLTGALPVDLWTKMTQLEYLWLRENKFNGPIPSTFGNMTSMRSLKLFKNELTGQLPTDLNLMTDMMELELDHNKFSGTIPYLAHMKQLERLSLNDNKLEKHIPFELFRFLNMRELRVEKNFLTGTVPPEMQSMRELRVLSLGSNNLMGTLDDSFDHFDYLEELRVQDNQFTGTIPTTLGHLTGMKHLILSGNEFSGTIPADIALMTSLEELRIFNNNLTGVLPSGICALKVDHALEFLALDCKIAITGCKDSCCDECL